MFVRHRLPLAILLLAAGPLRAADSALDQDQAMAWLRAGKRQDALHALDAIIASRSPDPSQALFVARLIDLEDGHRRLAKPYIQQLVKLRPSSMPVSDDGAQLAVMPPSTS